MRKVLRSGLMVFVLLVAAAPFAAGAEMEHGGMKMEGMPAGHGEMMTMGDKVFAGKIGPWTGVGRLVDMKAQMEKAMASGMKMEGAMKTHHLAVAVADPATKKPVTEGKGTVAVTGPDRKTATSDLVAMQGHFGADVELPKPGKYTFKLSIESGGRKGTATFTHVVK